MINTRKEKIRLENKLLQEHPLRKEYHNGNIEFIFNFKGHEIATWFDIYGELTYYINEVIS